MLTPRIRSSFIIVSVALFVPVLQALEIDRVEGTTLHFRASTTPPDASVPKPLKTNLQEMKGLGILNKVADTLPYALVTAKAPNNPEDRAIFMIRVDGGKQTQLVHPGRIMDPKSGIKVMDSQAFFGRCLPNRDDIYVSYQVEIVDKRRRGRRYRSTEPSMLIMEPHPDGFHEQLQELRSLSTLNARKADTLKRVKRKECFAIEGRNRNVASKLILLNPQKEEEAVDDEDDTPAAGTENGAEPSTESPGEPPAQAKPDPKKDQKN